MRAGQPMIGIVKGIHQPEHEAVERRYPGQGIRLCPLHGLAEQTRLTGAQLPQAQAQMADAQRIDLHQPAAGQVHGQAVAPGHQQAQVGGVAVERPIPILAHTAVDYAQVRPDAAVEVHDALLDAPRVHRPPVLARQQAHQVLHRHAHARDDVRLEDR